MVLQEGQVHPLPHLQVAEPPQHEFGLLELLEFEVFPHMVTGQFGCEQESFYKISSGPTCLFWT